MMSHSGKSTEANSLCVSDALPRHTLTQLYTLRNWHASCILLRRRLNTTTKRVHYVVSLVLKCYIDRQSRLNKPPCYFLWNNVDQTIGLAVPTCKLSITVYILDCKITYYRPLHK